MKIESIERRLEQELSCKIILAEGIGAIGIKPFWNWQTCDYDGQCALQDFREKHQPKPCLYNPKMFRCPAHQYYQMPLLLNAKN